MEKRLFLAVALSLLVVFVFQSWFSPKTAVSVANTQTVDPVTVSTFEPLEKTLVDHSKPLTKANFTEKVHSVHAGKFDLELSNNGGTISKVRLSEYDYVFPVENLGGLSALYGNQFYYNKVNSNTILLSASVDVRNIEKTITVKNYNLDIKYKIKNTSSVDKTFNVEVTPFDIDLSRLDDAVLKSDWTLFEYAFKLKNKIERKEQVWNFSEKWNKNENKEFSWISFRDRYFVTIVEPNTAMGSYKTTAIGDKKLSFIATGIPVIVEANKTIEYSFTVFCGPQKLDVLKEAKPGFENVLVFSSWGWLDFIAKGIYWLLGEIHKILPVWGLCIILVSLIVYGSMYPLTLKSMLSMKKMQALQPKMAQLKEKYKNNPEKLNKEIVELYRINNVNPVSGCLPMLLQMPIFVGLYQVLWRSFYFRGESFLWMKDLSMPDRLFKFPVSIPFLGEYFNILPVLMIFIMLAQQLLTLKSMAGGDSEQVQQQKIMAVFFPIFLGFIFYNFASGLNLYFVVFYFLSALSQWHISQKTRTES